MSVTRSTVAMAVLAVLMPAGWAAEGAVGEPPLRTASVVRSGDIPQPARSSVQPEQLRRVIQRHVEQELGDKVHEVQVTLLDPQEPIPMPAGRIDIAVLPGGREEGLGRRMFHLQLSVNGRAVENVDAWSDVAGYADVVVPARLIKMDEVIEAEDVALSRVKLLDLRQPFLLDLSEAIGKSAARPLQSQLPIRSSSLKKPCAVRKGDRVTIEARAAGLSIHAVGVTKSGGELGQMVTVTNSDSGKELRAKVVSPGVVRVDF